MANLLEILFDFVFPFCYIYKLFKPKSIKT